MAGPGIFGIGEIRPPDDGFSKFVLYREPYEEEDIWIIFPETEETYKVNIKFLEYWLPKFYGNDIGFVGSTLDHFWNFYHCELRPGVFNVKTLPLSDAYSYNLGGDGLDLVAKLANRIRSALP
jgi:hypothetical protein